MFKLADGDLWRMCVVISAGDLSRAPSVPDAFPIRLSFRLLAIYRDGRPKPASCSRAPASIRPRECMLAAHRLVLGAQADALSHRGSSTPFRSTVLMP